MPVCYSIYLILGMCIDGDLSYMNCSRIQFWRYSGTEPQSLIVEKKKFINSSFIQEVKPSSTCSFSARDPSENKQAFSGPRAWCK